MKNIIFIAPPAAGKGTVSDYLIKNYHYKYLSTGNMLRAEIASDSEFGQEISKIISSGNLISDETVINLVKLQLAKISGQPFILDGFPRTLKQAESLDEMLVSLGVTNSVVLFLDIDEELALKRILGRVNCPNCRRSYNIYFENMKPKNESICDDCSSGLVKRSDDNEKSFKKRFDTYMNNVDSIKEYYRQKHLLVEIMVDNNLERVLQEVIKEAKND